MLCPDPGSELHFPAAADCSAAPWCARWGEEVPGAAAVPLPGAPSFSRGRSWEPVLWPELRLRLLPVQRLQSPDPPGTRSRNTTSEPLRESELQKWREKDRMWSVEQFGKSAVKNRIQRVYFEKLWFYFLFTLINQIWYALLHRLANQCTLLKTAGTTQRAAVTLSARAAPPSNLQARQTCSAVAP